MSVNYVTAITVIHSGWRPAGGSHRGNARRKNAAYQVQGPPVPGVEMRSRYRIGRAGDASRWRARAPFRRSAYAGRSVVFCRGRCRNTGRVFRL
jgi:hypothetical protein